MKYAHFEFMTGGDFKHVFKTNGKTYTFGRLDSGQTQSARTTPEQRQNNARTTPEQRQTDGHVCAGNAAQESL